MRHVFVVNDDVIWEPRRIRASATSARIRGLPLHSWMPLMVLPLRSDPLSEYSFTLLEQLPPGSRRNKRSPRTVAQMPRKYEVCRIPWF
jgi:hypothetical protein